MQQHLNPFVSFDKRAFGPSLFFCALTLFAWFTQGGHFAIGWAGLVCLVALFVFAARDDKPVAALTLTALAFAGWLLLSAAVFNPVWHADALYFVLPFAIAMLAFRAIAPEALPRYFAALIVLLLLLTLHGILQVYFHWGYLSEEWPRATSVIRVPNSYATLVNLGLLPLIALYLLRQPSRSLLALIAILFAALLLSQSRGGQLAFVAGGAFLAWVVWRQGDAGGRLPWRSVAASLLGTTLLIEFSKRLLNTPNVFERVAHSVADKGSGRLHIYEMAWNLIKEDPFGGIGYYNFQYFFLRDKYPHFGDGLAYFVHNDYLQIWLETGLVGLLLLLALIAAFYWTLARRWSSVLPEHRATVAGLGAAVTAVFAHAAVDFPLYPGVITLLLGAALGVVSHLTAARQPQQAPNLLDRRPLRLALALLVLWWPGQQVIANISADRALARLAQGDAVGAVEAYTLAHRFAPRDPHFPFAAGVIWFNAAADQQNRDAAAEADRLFALGTALNPYDFRNLNQRLILHRDHGHLLAQPADQATLLAWADEIYTWLPTDDSVARQYARTLARIGRPREALAHIDDYHAKGLIDTTTAQRWKGMIDLQP